MKKVRQRGREGERDTHAETMRQRGKEERERENVDDEVSCDHQSISSDKGRDITHYQKARLM